MAKKKTKFPLKLKNDIDVRTLDELHEHFDLEKIIGYLQDGRLLTWLNDRYYEDEANQVENLDKSDGNIGAELCRIFRVEIEKSDLSSLDAESIKVRNERIARLKQYPDGITAIDHVDCVAFNQEELNKLLDNGVSEIYLCNGKFTIPIKQKNKKYIGIGKVECVIHGKKAVDFDTLGIRFENIQFDEAYKKALQSSNSKFAKKADVEKKYKFFMAACNAEGPSLMGILFGSGEDKTYSKLCKLKGTTIVFGYDSIDNFSDAPLEIQGVILSTKSENRNYKITAKMDASLLKKLKRYDMVEVTLQDGNTLVFTVTELISDREAAKRKDCRDS